MVTFEQFYKQYPKKTNKQQALKIWAKLKGDKKMIAYEDVLNRIQNHSQWKEKKYIPNPARYLARELWNDEIITDLTKQEKQADNEDGSVLSRFWTMLIQIYGSKFENSFGEQMPIAWQHGLRNMTQQQASKILNYLVNDNNQSMPDLPRICRLRRIYLDVLPEFKMLPRLPSDPKIGAKAFKRLKTMLKY